MTGFFSRFLGDGDWNLESVKPPWGARPSIYDHVSAHIIEGEYGLAEGGDTLPDEAEAFGEDDLRWISGGLDGAFGHHVGASDENETAKTVLKLLKAVLNKASDGDVEKLYAAMKDGSSIDFIDPLLDLIVDDGGIDAARLYSLAIWLATEAADREPVKPTARISGCVTSAAPTARLPPWIRLKVPAGMPQASTAAAMACAANSPVPGWAEWPLTTTGHPAASADAVSPPAVEKASGKFEAPKTATGPVGT